MKPSRRMRLARSLAFALIATLSTSSVAQEDVSLIRLKLWQSHADFALISAGIARDARNTNGVYDAPRKALDTLVADFPEALKGAGSNASVISAVKAFYIAAQGCLGSVSGPKYMFDIQCSKQKEASATLTMELSIMDSSKPKKKK